MILLLLLLFPLLLLMLLLMLILILFSGLRVAAFTCVEDKMLLTMPTCVFF